jgi:tellurite resistance protein TerC
MVDRFIYLKTGLALILGFVGMKMILAKGFPIHNWISLVIIVAILTVTITASMMATRRQDRMTDAK